MLPNGNIERARHSAGRARDRPWHHVPVISTVRGCVVGLLGGASALARRAPCPCRRPAPSPGSRPETSTAPTVPASAPEPEPAPADPSPARTNPEPPAPEELAAARALELPGGGEVPPGPWRWRWVWPTPGRPAGAALVAADGTLVLWSPGGFAEPGRATDGRPTPDVADALAALPDLVGAAAGIEALQAEVERARAVADETRRLLARAADAVDDELDRAAQDVPGAAGSDTAG